MTDSGCIKQQPANSAVVPVSKLENDSYDWWTRHADILRVQHSIDPEIVLIGDSITHFWGGANPKPISPMVPRLTHQSSHPTGF
jgi:hypothetical protein